MRVFVTGATGFIGSAVVRELLAHGHDVLGLARSDQGASYLQSLGSKVHRGDLEDQASLSRGAEAAEAVIHTGFLHDFTRFPEACAIDQAAISAIGATMKGSGKPFIVTAGVAFIEVRNGITTEADAAREPSATYPRASEASAQALAGDGVRASVMRLPPSVHGAGDRGFVPMLIDIARRTGKSAYIGEGLNQWPAVHRQDAATAFRLALERDTAGETFHAVAEEGVLFRNIATAIAEGLNVPCVSITEEEASAHFSWFAPFAAIHQPASSERTRNRLGWSPVRTDLLSDIGKAGYFSS